MAGRDFLVTVLVLLKISEITSEERNASSFQCEQFLISSFATKILKTITKHKEITTLKSV